MGNSKVTSYNCEGLPHHVECPVIPNQLANGLEGLLIV